MGTNYYARLDACEHCGRSDVSVHICKSLTMFCGYPEWEVLGAIGSVADWRVVLRRPGVRVFDEYGDEHGVEEFIAEIDSTKPESRRRQYDWVVQHGRSLDDDWLDAEGFSFCSREFS